MTTAEVTTVRVVARPTPSAVGVALYPSKFRHHIGVIRWNVCSEVALPWWQRRGQTRGATGCR